MKRLLILPCFALSVAFAQNVAINNTGAVGNPNAILDVDVSTNDKGVIIPRLSTAERTGIAGLGAADEGLTVYDETTNSFWFWDGTQWVQMQNAGGDWQLAGNAGTNPATNFVGTTDGNDLAFRTNNIERMRIMSFGNIGIGTPTPATSAKLEITSTTQGLLIPRVSLVAVTNGVTPVNTPSVSLMVYNTNAAVTGGSGVGFYFWDGTQWQRILSSTATGTAWTTTGNAGTNATTNFVGTTDNMDFVTRTNNTEKMRVTSAGSVGIGITIPTQRLDVQGGNGRINNVFIGDVGHGPTWGGVSNSSQNTTTGYGLLMSNDGNYTFINKLNTGVGYIGFRMSNIDVAVINGLGNMGIGTTAPQTYTRLQVVGGSIMPQTGNTNASGIYFPINPGGGGGDEAYIRHYVEGGENTKLVIANVNDPDDDISFRTGLAANERVQINGNGTVFLNRGVFFDCNDCGGTANGNYDLADGGGGNWGDLSIQGRVISTNSNLHLSPPGGNRVIINSAYRAAGGGTGTTGLDIEDGGIRMRKNYRWINRYGSTGGYGWGSQTHNLGNWDFCAIGHVGFRNTNSTTDEDDDVQCAVYPQAHADAGEANQWDSWFTYQYNQRPLWYMYLEGYADTNATNCAAMCMNFD